MYTHFIHKLRTIECVTWFIFLPWIHIMQAHILDWWSNNLYYHFVYIWLSVYAYKMLVVLFFNGTNWNRKYRILCLWQSLNIRSQKYPVKFWFSGLKISLNPIKIKLKPTFIVNIFPFQFIHIFWFRRFLFCLFNFPESDIFYQRKNTLFKTSILNFSLYFLVWTVFIAIHYIYYEETLQEIIYSW